MLEFQSASSFRINKDKTSSNKITIPAFTLDEASSVDGRNIYFPLGASFTGKTADMFFREGNRGDENVHYVYKDFPLKGTSGNTPVYIKSYEIKIEEADSPHDSDVNATYHDQLTVGYDSQGKPNSQTIPCDNCPIRLAFIADSGVKPVVIDPSAQVVDYVDNSNIDEHDSSVGGVVSLVDANGVPTRESSNPNHNWNSFATYYYGNTPLFIIPGGETLNVTLVVWLEGTLPNCDKYIGKHISVDIDIESNFADMDTITFYDDSQPDNTGGQTHWVSNDDPIVACSYEDPFSNENPKRWKTVIMSKTAEYTWQAKIPKKAVTNISFYRLSRANGPTQSTIYNAWHTTSSINTWITASSINSSWYRTGRMDLQTTRQYDDPGGSGTKLNALVYTAVHGNGYSITSSTPRRLAPCVGYWNYTDSSGGSTSPTTSGGGGSSSSTYNIQINVNDNTSAHWIQSNITYSQDKLYFSTANGSSGQLTQNGTNKFTWSGTLSANDEITSFYLTNSSGSTYRTWIPSRIFTVTSDYIISYYVNTSDQMMLQ